MYEELVETLRETADKRMHEAANAIEELAKDLEQSKEYETFWNKEAEEALRRFQVAVANKPRWIPVTERLPECDQVVLCYKKYRGVRIGKYLAATFADGVEAFKDLIGDYAFGATHWMPLPEPPKGE